MFFFSTSVLPFRIISPTIHIHSPIIYPLQSQQITSSLNKTISKTTLDYSFKEIPRNTHETKPKLSPQDIYSLPTSYASLYINVSFIIFNLCILFCTYNATIPSLFPYRSVLRPYFICGSLKRTIRKIKSLLYCAECISKT